MCEVRGAFCSNFKHKHKYLIRISFPLFQNIQGVECGLKKIKVNQQEPAKYEYKFRLPGQKFENKSKLEITPSLVSQCNGEPKTQSLTQISYDLDFKSDIKVIVPSPSDER